MQRTAARRHAPGSPPRMARVQVAAGEDSVIGAAGVVLWGTLLDRLGLIELANARGLRAVGGRGYSGGVCYRTLTETMLAGGDFLSDRFLLADEATARLRGTHRLPSVPTLTRFLGAAGLGEVAKAQAVNRALLARAWAMGAGPEPGLLTIDIDPTMVRTYGPGKQRTAFSRRGEVGLAPMLGVLAETGDVLGVRARGAAAGMRGLGRFVDECVSAIPRSTRAKGQLWLGPTPRPSPWPWCSPLDAMTPVSASRLVRSPRSAPPSRRSSTTRLPAGSPPSAPTTRWPRRRSASASERTVVTVRASSAPRACRSASSSGASASPSAASSASTTSTATGSRRS